MESIAPTHNGEKDTLKCKMRNLLAKRIMPSFVSLIAILISYYGLSQERDKEALTDISFISTWDNTEQHYIKILPKDFVSNQLFDLIIGLHGHGADRWQFATDERPECAAFREFASQHRMIAISPDYRAKTSWMGEAAEWDVLQIINELKAMYHVGRVFLVGGSMGGTSALTFAALHPELVDGVVAMNGHANHLEFDHFQDAIAQSFGGGKKDIPMEYKKRSAEYWPERLSMPIAFTVGMADTIVPPNSIIRLSNILKLTGKNSFLITNENGGHDTSFADAMRSMGFMIRRAKCLQAKLSVSMPNSA